jgi:uncharacterized protein
LTTAIEIGDEPMIRFLIESGANTQGSQLQCAALELAVVSDHRDVLALLIEKGFDVNATDKLGMTALHYAAMADYGDTEIARKLLAAGAKRDIKDKDGETAAAVASRLQLNQLAEALGTIGIN